MDLRHVRYAITIARAGSLRRASTVLHIAQPTLSEQLRALEKEIGVELFTRSSSGVRLTEAGEVFLAQATVAVDAFERAVAAARGKGQTVRLGVADGLGDVVARLLSQVQGSRLRVAPMCTAEQIISIMDGTLQAGLGYAPGSLPRGVARSSSSGPRYSPCCPAITGWPRSSGCGSPIWRRNRSSCRSPTRWRVRAGSSKGSSGSACIPGSVPARPPMTRPSPWSNRGPATRSACAAAFRCRNASPSSPSPRRFRLLRWYLLWNRQADVDDLVHAARHLARSG